MSLSYRNRSRGARNLTNQRRRDRVQNDGRAPDTRREIERLDPMVGALENLLDFSRSTSLDESSGSSVTNPRQVHDDEEEPEVIMNFTTYLDREEQRLEENRVSLSRQLREINDGNILNLPRRRSNPNYIFLNNDMGSNGSDSDYREQ